MTIPASGATGRRRGRHRPRLSLFALALGLLLILALAVAGTLSALARSDAGEDGGAQSLTGALDAVRVSGRVGATPVVVLDAPVTVGAVKAKEIETGTGREITEGSPVLLSLTSFDGRSGDSTSASGRPSLLVGKASAEVLGRDIAELVIGRTEGTRILALHPLAEEPGSASAGTEISVIDILPSIATGEAPASGSSGPLSVEMTPEGPVISHGSEEAGGLEVQTLLEGAGAQVAASDRIVAQYAVVGWSDSVVRASTWQTGMPELVPLAEAMTGLREAVTDRRVGSRLAVTIPADLATGDDALCVVIDILGTEPATDAADADGPSSAGSAGPADAAASAS